MPSANDFVYGFLELREVRGLVFPSGLITSSWRGFLRAALGSSSSSEELSGRFRLSVPLFEGLSAEEEEDEDAEDRRAVCLALPCLRLLLYCLWNSSKSW